MSACSATGVCDLYISSDTNIWIDFFEIKHVDHPFLLEHEFYLSAAAYEDELLKSEELRKALLAFGLRLADITDEEFSMAESYRRTYRKLSLYDAFALAIAKARSWTLLTGDQPLRTAAEHEGIECHGVIWVYDELLHHGKISSDDFRNAMQLLLAAVQEGRCRLPVNELIRRIEGR